MNWERYRPYLTEEYLMGPNSLLILEELLSKSPAQLNPDSLILDLGCGKGLTSFALCTEIGAKVFANDLWISSGENAERFARWGVSQRITPVHENADCLHFEENSFDAIVSVDAYHYFGGTEGYFRQKILPLLKPGGAALIGVPGIRDEFDERTEELLAPWLGSEHSMFHSPRQWRRILGDSADMADVQVWEMSCFAAAWRDWLQTENPFAQGDLAVWKTIIEPYTNLIGMIVRKK